MHTFIIAYVCLSSDLFSSACLWTLWKWSSILHIPLQLFSFAFPFAGFVRACVATAAVCPVLCHSRCMTVPGFVGHFSVDGCTWVVPGVIANQCHLFTRLLVRLQKTLPRALCRLGFNQEQPGGDRGSEMHCKEGFTRLWELVGWVWNPEGSWKVLGMSHHKWNFLGEGWVYS